MPRRDTTGKLVSRSSLQFAMTQPTRNALRRGVSLTRVEDFKYHQQADIKALQERAYLHAKVLGEVGGVSHLKANTVSQAVLRIKTYDEEGEPVDADPQDHVKVFDVMKAFIGPKGGTKELLRKAALNLDIAGEAWLVGTPQKTKDEFGQEIEEGVVWEFLSVMELKLDGKQVQRSRSLTNGGREFVPDDAYIARLWHSDPQYSDQADSALMRVDNICKEAVVLTQVVDAVAKTRLSNGILLVPDDYDFGPEDETVEGEEPDDKMHPFARSLVKYIREPVVNRESAASLTPWVIPYPRFDRNGNVIEHGMAHLEIAKELDGFYSELRQEALGRIANGLDAPAEIMQGKSDLNHWTGANVDAEFLAKHIDPLGQEIAEFVTENYLRPMLIEFEELSEEEANLFWVEFDSEHLATRADAAQTARAAYDRGAIKLESYLRAIGMGPEDIPDDEERLMRVTYDLLQGAKIGWGAAALPIMFASADPKVLALAEALAESFLASRRAVGEEPEEGEEPEVEDIEEGPDAEDGDDRVPAVGDETPGVSEASLNERLATASDAALKRALERKGNQLRNKAPDPLKARVAREQNNLRVVSTCSIDELMEVFDVKDPLKIFSGEFGQLHTDTQTWVRAFMIEEGAPAHLVDEAALTVADELVMNLSYVAVGAVAEPPKIGANGLIVPEIVVDRALAAMQAVRW